MAEEGCFLGGWWVVCGVGSVGTGWFGESGTVIHRGERKKFGLAICTFFVAKCRSVEYN